jgi:hypothetical protein
MAVAGNSYDIPLIQAYLDSGVQRHTNSRGIVYGEGYIHIPAHFARSFDLYNSSVNPNRADVLGVNIFNCTSADGSFRGMLKAGGSSKKGDAHAKQFTGSGDLKALGAWYAHVNAQAGDHVEVTWTSPTDIVIRHY